MIILDTDCLSLLERQSGTEYLRLQSRLDELPSHEITTTIITYEEQMRGWLAYLSKLRSIDDQIWAYETLRMHFDYFKKLPLLDFDKKAADVFKELKANKVRIGTMDLKIASIAIANDAILPSRNLADFELVPDLAVQDWTLPISEPKTPA